MLYYRSMDTQTADYYSSNAGALSGRYRALKSEGISRYFREAFPGGDAYLLDVGCGSGRDLEILHKMGYHADGVDPCGELLALAESIVSGYGTRLFRDSLPDLSAIPDSNYDGILCSAVLQHIPEEQLFDAAFALRRILRKNGRLLISIPLGDTTIDPDTRRDPDGRLFNMIVPEELQLLFERIGFKMFSKHISPDSIGRKHRQWAVMAFQLQASRGERPVDTIESVLNKDSKVATYKLALFRAFAEIATTNYKQARWTDDGRVKIDIGLLAEKWIAYYWPLIEAGIKQTTGTPVAFTRELEALISFYSLQGGLSAFSMDLRNRSLPPEGARLYKSLLSKMKATIWKQPVRYAGPGQYSIFQYDKNDKTVLIGHDIWHELSMMGHWIQDACILRWAELAAKISNQSVKPSEVIECLLAVPVEKRAVNAAKCFYDSLDSKVCVWSGKPLDKRYELDHAIPFCLWKNNDLWNLLPADKQENSRKRDKLPESKVVRNSRDCIIHYWEMASEKFPGRFEREAVNLTGRQLDRNNWENQLFATFAEAIEITAIQRGVERWQPASFAATGTEGAFSGRDVICRGSNIEKKIEIIKFSYEDIPAKEAFIRFLPFAGKLTAGLAPHFGFDLGNLDIEARSIQWIEAPQKLCSEGRFVIQVIGDSMEPTIMKHDYVVCEYHRHVQPGHRIVIMADFSSINEGECAVKRISEKHDRWIFSSDNPAYPDIPVRKLDSNDELPILGTCIYNLSRECKIR